MNMKSSIATAMLGLFCLSSHSLFSAVAGYGFTQVPEQYVELGSPTIVMMGNQDDVMTAPISIGFNFVYDDLVYDQLKINSNGFLTLDPLSDSSYQNTLYYTPLIMAGFWDDLQTNNDSGSISFQLSGTAPQRVFTVQFKNMNWYYSEPGNLINFQISLHETSNVIKYVYGPMGNSPGEYGSAAIGLSGSVEGDFLSVTPGSPTGSASPTLEFISITGAYIPYLIGVSYLFTPPVGPGHDLQALSLSGSVIPVQNQPESYSFRIRNRGQTSQNAYTLRLIAGSIQLASQAGPPIQPGEILDVNISCSFPTVGPQNLQAEIVLATDQNPANDLSPLFPVSVQTPGTQTVTIGAGDLNNRIPLDFYWKNNLFECIYLPSELTQTGLITGIELYTSFTDDFSYGKPTRIWLGETTVPDLSGGWIPSTQLNLVFDGLVSYPAGINSIMITLQTAYPYQGGNLVMMAQRPMDAEYYSGSNTFRCQFIEGASRSLKVWSDSYLFDPASPPPSSASGLYPQTSFYIVTQGTGSVAGIVNSQGLPLEGARLSLDGTALATDSQAGGLYSFPFVAQGSYQLTCSKFGYISQTLTVSVTANQPTVLNLNLLPLPTINITGRVTGSNAPLVGISGASILLDGIQNHAVLTDPQGYFVIQNVFANQSYDYNITKIGYDSVVGSIIPGSADHDMGVIVMNERANPPAMVQAVETPVHVSLSWTPPNPMAEDVTQSFESSVFPPPLWTQTITNTQPPNSYGVAPTWSRVGVIPLSGLIYPPHGDWQAAIWWSNEHQDEWLITPQFVCPAQAVLMFNGHIYLGPSPSGADDRVYVKLSLDNGVSWSVLWDSVTAGPEAWSDYYIPFIISLEDYAYSSIKLAWHADDPSDNSGMWNVSLIDNILVQNPDGIIRFDEADLISASGQISSAKNASKRQTLQPERDSRALLGYRIWRLTQGQESDPSAWTALNQEPLPGLSYQDPAWNYLLEGSYRWAIKAVYSNGIISQPAFSNILLHPQQASGTIIGVVRTGDEEPVSGAVITAGFFSTTSFANGYYSLPVSVGTYEVSCTANGYGTISNPGIVVQQDQTTVCNFTLGVGTSDPILEVQTALLGNYPNPFNPITCIKFSVKQPQRVVLAIYNLKGELVRVLLDGPVDRGQNTVYWNGCDAQGRPVSGGVYFYRMHSADLSAVRKMILLK